MPSLRRRPSTMRAFEEKYRRKTFKWQGEVSQIREGLDLVFMKTKSIILVKMYPPRFAKRASPDVALLFGDELNAEVALLNQGDWVEFEGTVHMHGQRGEPEVLALYQVSSLPKPVPLSSTPLSLAHHGKNVSDVRHHSFMDELRPLKLDPSHEEPSLHTRMDSVAHQPSLSDPLNLGIAGAAAEIPSVDGVSQNV